MTGMRVVFAPFNGSHYLAVDQVALARTAATLLPLIPELDTSDSYSLERTLRPLLIRAINHDIDSPILEHSEIINGKYFFERQEGILPSRFSSEFNTALSRFLVRAMSMSLKDLKLQTIDEKLWALVEMRSQATGQKKFDIYNLISISSIACLRCQLIDLTRRFIADHAARRDHDPRHAIALV